MPIISFSLCVVKGRSLLKKCALVPKGHDAKSKFKANIGDLQYNSAPNKAENDFFNRLEEFTSKGILKVSLRH